MTNALCGLSHEIFGVLTGVGKLFLTIDLDEDPGVIKRNADLL
jgi:hypothetical protein